MSKATKNIVVDHRCQLDLLDIYFSCKRESSQDYYDDYEDWYSCFGGYPSDDYDDDFYDYDNDIQNQLNAIISEAFGFRTPKTNKKIRKTVSEKNRNLAKEKRERYKKAHHQEVDNSDFGDKEVYYYRDYNDPDTYEKFFSLYEFDEFCNSEGIYVSQEEVMNLMRRDISHCCIDPASASLYGQASLVTDSSYGGLRWACAESDEEIESMTVGG